MSLGGSQLGPACSCPQGAEGRCLTPLLLPLPPPRLPPQVGVSEGRLRKWLLSISAFLRMQVRVFVWVGGGGRGVWEGACPGLPGALCPVPLLK